jgi:hypothetical protein
VYTFLLTLKLGFAILKKPPEMVAKIPELERFSKAGKFFKKNQKSG